MALAPRLAPGSIFARDYQIVDLLAEGGMGAVYRAEQLSTRKLRALKLVSTRLAADPKARQRFVREATVGASIDSEHVVEVIGAGIDEDSGQPWLVMELLDGADLGAVARHQGPLSPGQLREVVGQLCHGLAAAHRAGVVHRDLKPANVFVARSRRAGVPFTLKILDFGIAKVVQESGSGATETDTVGSPLWMAPEQLNAQRPTPATDVWALGLLAFWALTGKHYWVAAHSSTSTVQALFVEQLFKPIDPPSQRALALGAEVGVPEGFDAWFLRCLDREPARRFPDAWTAGEELRALLPAEPEAAARLLPDVPLRPSNSELEPHHHSSPEATQTASGTPWEASAVVPATAVAAARSSFEGDATRTDSTRLGADLSHAPISSQPGATSARTSVSPVAVALSVALVVGAVLGGGYLAWQWAGHSLDGRDHATQASTTAALATEPAPHQSEGSTTSSDTAGDTAGTTTAPPGDDHVRPSSEPEDPALALVVPMRTQLDHEAHAAQFLGFSESGHRFVLQVEHRADRKLEPNRLTLIQVHDSLSGTMIESFLVAREAGPGVSRSHRLSKAAAEARPHAEWAEARKALRLTKPAPRRTGPGDAQVLVEADEPPPGTAMALPPSGLGAAFRWSVRPDVAQQGPDRDGPEVRLELARGQERWRLLELQPPFSSHQLAALVTAIPPAPPPQEGSWEPPGQPTPPQPSEDPAAIGRIMAYWSPDGTRVLLLIEAETRPPGEPPLRQHRWVMRAVGPQIRLVEAGAGQRRARELALRLAAEGLPVAVVDLRAPASAESKLIYDRAHERARTLAERIGAGLPVQPEPQPKRFTRDFVEVIAILGHDAG